MAYVDKAEIENNARSVGFRILKIEYLKETVLKLDFSLDLVFKKLTVVLVH